MTDSFLIDTSGCIAISQKCKIYSLLENAEVIPKKSVSSSAVVLANLNSKGQKIYETTFKNVSLKISFNQKKKSIDNSLSVEIYIYKNFVNKLLKKTPNIVTFIAAFSCKNFIKHLDCILNKNNKLAFIDNLLVQLLEIQWKDEEKQIFDLDRVNILMLEKTQGITLYNVIKDISFTDFKSILFQILFTFEMFNRIGLRHNDTHLDNIFIDDGDKSFYVYKLDEHNSFKVQLTKHVKIFDFDLSYIKGKKNTKLERMCKRHGTCNVKNTKFDTFKLLNIIYELLTYDLILKKIKKNEKKYIIDFIECHISINLLTKFKKDGVLCKNVPPKDECLGNFIPYEKEMSSTQLILMDKFFEEFRTK